MSKLIVYTYNTEEKADEVLAAIAGMKQENVQKPLFAIEDAATIVKNAKGKIRVRQTLESIAKGSNVASGSFWGLLIGFLFGGPLLGALLGMAFSAIFGRNIDLGIDNSFITGVGDELSPGDSALFLLIGDTPVETIEETMSQYGGNLYHTNFSKEAAAAIKEASDHAPIADAINSQED